MKASSRRRTRLCKRKYDASTNSDCVTQPAMAPSFRRTPPIAPQRERCLQCRPARDSVNQLRRKTREPSRDDTSQSKSEGKSEGPRGTRVGPILDALGVSQPSSELNLGTFSPTSVKSNGKGLMNCQ